MKDVLPVPRPLDIKQKMEAPTKLHDLNEEKQNRYIGIVEDMINKYKENNLELLTQHTNPESDEAKKLYKNLDESIVLKFENELFVHKCQVFSKPVESKIDEAKFKKYDFITTVMILENGQHNPFMFQCQVKL